MFKRSKQGAFSVAMSALLVTALVAPAAAQAVTIKLSGSTTVQPIAQKLGTAYKKAKGKSVVVTGGGSSVGVNDALAGRVDVGMSSRDLKSTEVDKGAVQTAFARDALAVVVNPKNKVSNLTEAQVKAIYTGKIKNWNQVGGPNRRIIVCGRTAASGTYEFFKESFLGGVRQYSGTRQYASNGMVRSQVARNKYAIGYVGMAFVNKTVKGLKMSGVSPTRANAISGKYKHVRYLYWVTKGAPSGEALSFIDWTRSKAGQNIVVTEFLKLN